MSNIFQEEEPQKKLDLSAVRFQAKVMRLRACKMRIDALIIRIETRAMREKNQNLAAIHREWFVK